jgi:hypothetical protein
MLSDCHTFKDPGDLLRGEPSGAPADERQKLSIEVKNPQAQRGLLNCRSAAAQRSMPRVAKLKVGCYTRKYSVRKGEAMPC